MQEPLSVFFGRGEREARLLAKQANRHGLITGATGTGKTVSLQVLAEGFSRLGVPVVLADVKGDLAALSQPIELNEKLTGRAARIDYADYAPDAYPCVFWDVFGDQGHPLRATLSEMGPLLLSRLLELNDTQEGVLNVGFKLADDQGLLLLDLKDLRSLLSFMAEHHREISTEYGRVTAASIGAIQRRLLVLEQQGAELFFGEPALALDDLMRVGLDGRGVINVLAADRLIHRPRLYATFLLWLLSELFEELPEIGDPERPKLVFFFDEAHLLFDDAPDALLDKVEQVVRLIRSKGVGVYFVTQNPLDVPDPVLAQLGNRIQHALRAYTPREQRAVRAAASTFRQNPAIDTETAIKELGVGEALVSTLDEEGVPTVVDRCLIAPPRSRIGTISTAERAAVRGRSPIGKRYDVGLDPESAHEILTRRAADRAARERAEAEREQAERERRRADSRRRTRKSSSAGRSRRGGSDGGGFEAVIKDAAQTIGSELGRTLLRGILGGLRRR